MTKGQMKIYEAINTYIKENNISPTVRELCRIAGYKSTSTVHRLLDELESKGFIKKKKDCPRSISIIGGRNYV